MCHVSVIDINLANNTFIPKQFPNISEKSTFYIYKDPSQKNSMDDLT